MAEAHCQAAVPVVIGEAALDEALGNADAARQLRVLLRGTMWSQRGSSAGQQGGQKFNCSGDSSASARPLHEAGDPDSQMLAPAARLHARKQTILAGCTVLCSFWCLGCSCAAQRQSKGIPRPPKHAHQAPRSITQGKSLLPQMLPRHTDWGKLKPILRPWHHSKYLMATTWHPAGLDELSTVRDLTTEMGLATDVIHRCHYVSQIEGAFSGCALNMHAFITTT